MTKRVYPHPMVVGIKNLYIGIKIVNDVEKWVVLQYYTINIGIRK